MAERRMFSKKITDDDNFVMLSSSAQALYFHLSMQADDDGFCNQVNASMFKAHASVEDLKSLLERRYVYQFEDGVIVIKHWRMANALRKDRYTPTSFQEDFAKLDIKDNGAYTLKEPGPDGCRVVAACLPQVRLGKNSIGKDSIRESLEPAQPASAPKPKKFVKPSKEEVIGYVAERGNRISAEAFYNYYEAGGWMVGKRSMKDWKAAVRYWEQNEKQSSQKKKTADDMSEEDRRKMEAIFGKE